VSTAGHARGWAANGPRSGIGRKPLPWRTAAKMQNCEVSLWVVDVAGCETLICASRSLGARSGGGPGMQWVGRTVRCRGTCSEVERWLLEDHTAESRLPRKHNTYRMACHVDVCESRYPPARDVVHWASSTCTTLTRWSHRNVTISRDRVSSFHHLP
jgi:hypothetical protein